MPKLLLVVPATLSHGNSRRIFSEFVSVPGNAVVLSTPSEPGTLANILFNEWNTAQSDNEKFGHGAVGQPIQLNSSMTLTVSIYPSLAGK